jgi:hypothetical protein
VRATFTAHGDRLRGFPVLSALLASARIPKPSHPAGILRTHLSSCGPSPCTRLSRAPSIMATLTPSGRIGGFRRLFATHYFHSPYHRSKGSPKFLWRFPVGFAPMLPEDTRCNRLRVVHDAPFRRSDGKPSRLPAPPGAPTPQARRGVRCTCESAARLAPSRRRKPSTGPTCDRPPAWCWSAARAWSPYRS